MFSRLMNHFIACYILTPKQHEFFKDKLTTSTWIKFIEYLLDQMGYGNATSAFIIAFDYLDHHIFLSKKRKASEIGDGKRMDVNKPERTVPNGTD